MVRCNGDIRETHMLEQLFGSRTRVKLLRLFLSNPDEEYYVRELTRRMDEQINSIRRELSNLEDMGMVVAEERELKKFYKVSTDHLLYPELRALFLKSQLTVERSFVQAIKDAGKIKLFILTGNFLKDPEVPVDLFMVGTVNRTKLEPLLNKFKEQFGFNIRFTAIPESEYYYRKDITDKFLYSILNSRKVVVFDELTPPPAQH